jgi:hypothetical protein
LKCECDMCSPYAGQERYDNLILVPDSNAVGFDEYPVRKAQNKEEARRTRTNLRSTIKSKAAERAKWPKTYKRVRQSAKYNLIEDRSASERLLTNVKVIQALEM